MARILLVEDDQTLSQLVREELTLFGHQVECVMDGALVEGALARQPPDLVLLDVMLPNVSGIELLKRIRAHTTGRWLPILMLTARGQESDRVAGLELGADDYLVKPFALRELLARVHAQLRRSDAMSQNKANAAEVSQQERCFEAQIDRAALKITMDDRLLTLSKLEFDLLCALIDAKGRALTREWLLNSVWGTDFDGTDRTVDNAILKLREKLGRDSAIAAAIVAVRGVGYRMERSPHG
jgi:two-component system, OmpR family, alkaline phosphatase synthesis response regulator PhoP